MSTNQKLRVDPHRWPGVYCYKSLKQKHEGKPDICYYICYRVDGKLKWEKIGWKSQRIEPAMAADARAKRLIQLRLGEEVKTSKEVQREKRARNRPLAEIVEAYFDSKGDALKGRTTDRNRWSKHLAPLVGTMPASDLSELDIARVKRAMQDRAPATIWNALELLRRIVNYGTKVDLCPPLRFKIEMPRKDNERTEYLSDEQATRFLRVLSEWRKQDVARMLKLAMVTGMRRGELFKLQTDDLDFRVGLITIRQPKGGKTVTIPMSDDARIILEAQLVWRDKKNPGSPYIFPGKDGRHRTDSTAADRIKVAAGLPKEFRIFHGLRHHFAVMLANDGQCTRDIIQELLTHKSSAMTQRYAKFLPDTKRKFSELGAKLVLQPAMSTKAEEGEDEQAQDEVVKD